MGREFTRRGDIEAVFELLTNKFETANSICRRANGKPYKYYPSYVRNLELLHKKGLVEKLEMENAKNKSILWRLKKSKK